MSEGDLMGKEKFVLRKERNFIKTIVFMWFYLLAVFFALHSTERGAPTSLGEILFFSVVMALFAALVMGSVLRPLTPLTMIIDWDKELLYLSDRKEESVTVRFNEIKWIAYDDLYRRRGIVLKLLNGNFYPFWVTVDPKDKERLLQAIGRLMEIIEDYKRSRGGK